MPSRLVPPRAVMLAALVTVQGACHRRNPAATSQGAFPDCQGQRYVTVTNRTSRTYDVYIRTSSTTRVYVTTVYANSRADAPVDPSITSGHPELVEVRQTSRNPTGPPLGQQYAVIVCR